MALQTGRMETQSPGPKKAKWAIVMLTQIPCNCARKWSRPPVTPVLRAAAAAADLL